MHFFARTQQWASSRTKNHVSKKWNVKAQYDIFNDDANDSYMTGSKLRHMLGTDVQKYTSWVVYNAGFLRIFKIAV